MKYLKKYKLFENNEIDFIDIKLAIFTDNIEQVKKYIDLGGDLEKPIYMIYSLLAYATYNTSVNVMNLLIENGADVNFIFQGNLKHSILTYSTSVGLKLSILINIIKHGADVWYEIANGKNFFDYFNFKLENLWKELPELKKEYLKRKNIKKFKI